MRMTGTATVARNFYEIGFNPFYPTSNICGAVAPDYFAMEFPLLQTLTLPFYYLFGEQYWIGRFVNWCVSCLGLWFFARLVTRMTDERTALYATLLFAGSITVTFMRKMMPDTFAVFLAIMGTYYLYVYLEEGGRKRLVFGGLLLGLGVLSKIPALVVACFLVVPFLDKAVTNKRRLWLFAPLGVAGTLTALWYFVWMPYLQDVTSCPPLIYPVSLAEGAQIFFVDMHEKSIRRFRDIAFTHSVPYWMFLVSFAFGLFRWRQWRLPLMTLAYTTLFLLFVFKTGKVFATHNYYVIPFIPLMALWAGKLLHEQLRHRYVALALTLVLCIPAGQYLMKDVVLNENAPDLRLEALLDDLGVGREDKIMIQDGWMEPTGMYFAHRRGWTVDAGIIDHHDWMPDYRRDGLQYLVVDKRRYDKPVPYRFVGEDEVWAVYAVNGAAE